MPYYLNLISKPYIHDQDDCCIKILCLPISLGQEHNFLQNSTLSDSNENELNRERLGQNKDCERNRNI